MHHRAPGPVHRGNGHAGDLYDVEALDSSKRHDAIPAAITDRKHSPDPRRWLVVFACFLAMLLCYVERVGFSIAYTAIASAAGTSESERGHVMSSFFWGYAVSQFPGGVIAHKYGGAPTLAASFLCWSAASLVMPLSGAVTPGLLLGRVLVGVSQGLVVPSVHANLAQWVSPTERSTAVSMTTSGMYLGSALSMLWLPSVAASQGARLIPKGVGAAGIAWTLAWLVVTACGTARPGRAPSTSAVGGEPSLRGPGDADSAHANRNGAGWGRDAALGNARLRSTGAGYDPDVPDTNGVSETNGGLAKKDAAPAETLQGRVAFAWRLLRMPPVMAICVNNFTFHYTLFLLMNWIPTFFPDLVHYPLQSMGAMKALPYLFMFASSVFGGWLGDRMVHSAHWPVAAARQALNSAGMLGASLSVVLMATSRSGASGLALAGITFLFQGLSRAGFSVNHLDIAPKHASIVTGLSNTFGTVAGIVGVTLTGWLLQLSGGAGMWFGWACSFGISAAFMVAGNAVFLRYSRGEVLLS